MPDDAPPALSPEQEAARALRRRSKQARDLRLIAAVARGPRTEPAPRPAP